MTTKSNPVLMYLNHGRGGWRKVHPLIYASTYYTYAELGKLLGHSNHSTVAIYTSRAKKDPMTVIPAEWVLPLAKLLEIKPARLRPDLYLSNWDLPKFPGPLSCEAA